MGTTLEDLNEGAKDLAGFDGTGASTDDFIPNTKWSTWTNQSIESLHKKLLTFNADYSVKFIDFTISDQTGTFTLPADFRAFRRLDRNPALSIRRPLHVYNLAAGATANGDLGYRIVGRTLYVERREHGQGNYRLWYVGGPTTLVPKPDPGAIVRAASAADLSVANPSQIWFPSLSDVNVMSLSGGGGPGGSLIVDGVNIGLNGLSGDKMLVRHGAAAVTPTVFARVLATSALPGTVLYFPEAGVPASTFLERFSSDPGYSLLTVDGVTLAGDVTSGDLVLLNGQANAVQNGLYRCQQNDLGGWRIERVNESILGPGTATSVNYNPAFAAKAARVGISEGDTHAGETWSISTGVSVDTAALAWIRGITPGKGLWLCGGTGENGRIFFTRLTPAVDAALIAKGFIVTPTEGAINAGLLFASNGNDDTIGTWRVGASDVSFDLVTTTNVLDSLYEPAVEWIMVRTAIRGLGRNMDGPTGNDLKARLVELTGELAAYAASLDSGESTAAVDVDEEEHANHWMRLFGG